MTLMQMPRLWVPNPIGRPMQFMIHTDDHITSPGAKASFTIEFSSGGGVNGETITIMDRVFTVDNSTPYTYNTFKADGTILQCAQNLMGAMQSNYWFADFQFYLSSPGGVNWIINAQAMTAGELDGWIFAEALTNGVALTDTNGSDTVLSRFAIWYRLYDEFAPVTEMRFANVPFDADFPSTSGRTTIDVEPIVRNKLGVKAPNMAQSAPARDLEQFGEFILRYGAVEIDENNNRVFAQSYQSAWFTAVNALFQHAEPREFLNYHPATIATVKWLTNRSNSLSICSEQYEWVNIWLDKNKIVDQDFRIVYTFKDAAGDTVNTLTETCTSNGVWVVPVGPANPSVQSSMTSDTTHYTIVVEALAINGDSDPVWITYSETLTRYLVPGCGCDGHEFYFLEDKGSFRTLQFDYTEELREEVEKDTSAVPIDWAITSTPDRRQFTEGGRDSVVKRADGVFVLLSQRLTEKTRPMYEDFLRSPLVYMRSTNGSNNVVRKVIFEAPPTVKQRGEVIRIEAAFRLNYERLTR